MTLATRSDEACQKRQQAARDILARGVSQPDKIFETRVENSQLIWLSHSLFPRLEADDRAGNSEIFEGVENVENDDEEALMRLKQERDSLLSELGLTDMKEADELTQEHIKQLHTYNEIKDIAQTLMGKIAESSGRRIADVYQDFDLELQD